MAWYVLFPIFITIFALAFYKKRWAGPIIVFLLFFFSAFRGDNVGNDTMNYMNWDTIRYKAQLFSSEDTVFEDFGGKAEVINNGLNAIVYYGNLKPRAIIYFYTIITLFVLIIAFRKFKINVPLASMLYVLLGLYFFSLTAARQICAVSFILLSYYYLNLNNNKRFLFFVFILIATLIHSFSIITLVIYPLRWISFNKKRMGYIIYVISAALVLLNLSVVPSLLSLFGSNTIQGYVLTYLESSNSLNIIGKSYNLIYITFLFIFYLRANNNKKTDIYDNLFIVSLFVYALFAPYSGLIGRIQYNLSIFQCIYLSNYLYDKTIVISKRKQLIVNPIIVCFFIFVCYKCSIIGTGGSLVSGYYLCF